MKTLFRISLCLFALILPSYLYAQQIGKIENGFNTEYFPEVSFTYHSDNPNLLDKSNFWYLKEADTECQFTIEQTPNNLTKSPQHTLILWEDLALNGYGQYAFTQKVLLGFFSRADILQSDKFAIYAFNRNKNKSNNLIKITNNFTNDYSVISSAIKNYKQSYEYYTPYPNCTDIYTAIREGMDILSPMKGTKAIILFTSGHPMSSTGADSEAQVLLKAQQLHIPVYIFQYSYKSGVATATEGFAKSTFGGFETYNDIAKAEEDLINLYPHISKRYQGNNYKITYISNAKRGSEARMITISVDGLEIQEQLLPPPHTLTSWVEDNIWLVIVLAVIIIGLTIGAILFVRKTQKAAAENLEKLEDLEIRRIQDKEAAEQRQREIEEKARREQENQAKRQAKQAEEERLQRLMAAKNQFPRLKCTVGFETFNYEITKPVTSLGRDSNNDVVLNNSKVSRQHAEIVFNGNSFEIIDKGSTNKVIVNGQFVERATLRSGDIIGLGEVVITFI